MQEGSRRGTLSANPLRKVSSQRRKNEDAGGGGGGVPYCLTQEGKGCFSSVGPNEPKKGEVGCCCKTPV